MVWVPFKDYNVLHGLPDQENTRKRLQNYKQRRASSDNFCTGVGMLRESHTRVNYNVCDLCVCLSFRGYGIC